MLEERRRRVPLFLLLIFLLLIFVLDLDRLLLLLPLGLLSTTILSISSTRGTSMEDISAR
jgi:hypothetical protein